MRTKSPSGKFGILVACITGAALLKYFLSNYLGTHLPFITFFPAVVVASLYAGFLYGAATAAVTLPIAWTTMAPSHEGVLTLSASVQLLLFFFESLLLAYLCDRTVDSLEHSHSSLQALKRAEENLRRREELWSITLRSIGDGVICTDAKGRITFLNDVASELTGYSEKEALGVSSEEVFRIVSEDTQSKLESPVQKVIERGEIVGLANHTILKHKFGEDKFIDDSAAPIRDSDGNLIGVVLVFRDVSEKKRDQATLFNSKERLRLALNAAKLGHWQWCVADDQLDFSERANEIFRLPQGSSITFKEFLNIVHPLDRERVSEEVTRSVEERRDYQIEYRCVSPKGEEFWVEALGRSFYGDDGEPIEMIGVIADITERKQLEEEKTQLLASERTARSEIERASRMKDEFLATLSHELRTPLNAIQGWIQLLRKGKLDDEKKKGALEIVERNARVQSKIIEDLLDMNRIISGKVKLDVQSVTLSTVLQNAIDSVRPAAEAKAISLVLNSSPSLIVRGDPARLQQVFWNLLSNAVKFTPNGGTVTTSVEKWDSTVEISVTDSGEGIKKEFLPFIFERFRQADSSTSRKYGGLGIGLSIVKHLVEMHGGRVQAKSGGERQGSTFQVLLPLTLPEQVVSEDKVFTPDRPPPHAYNDAPTSLKAIKVLVVDDQPDSRDLVRQVLEDYEAEVVTASSADEALTLLRSFVPDVVVSDIGMPQRDGYELIKEIRKLPQDRGGGTPAIALTAFARSEDRVHALKVGYQMHLPKPVEPLELIAVVASVIKRD